MDPFLLTAIGSAIMAAAALVTSWSNYRNRKAGADKTASESWATLLKPLQDRIAELVPLQARVSVLEITVTELTEERDSLRVAVAERDRHIMHPEAKIVTLEARVELLTTQRDAST